MTYAELFSSTLESLGDHSCAADVQVLIETAFNITRTQYWMRKDEPIGDDSSLRKFYRYRRRLLEQEPLAYILKEKEFYGEPFYVDSNVLIPRPETELLVERVLEKTAPGCEILDIGTGSGVIAVMLAKLAGARVTAVDISPGALEVLKKNILRHGVQDKVFPLQADLFPPPGPTYGLVVSNPPYIPEFEWQTLAPSVRDHEPKTALASGTDGLTAVRRIITAAAETYLKPGGHLFMEIGYNQKEAVQDLLERAKFMGICFYPDYSGIQRIAHGQVTG